MPRRDPNEKTLRPVHPNAGVEAEYRRKLDAIIKEMSASYEYWLTAAYRANVPAIAMDAPEDSPNFGSRTPAAELLREISKLGERWERQFDEAAPRLAAYFARAAAQRSDGALRSILRKSGFSVKFTMTAPMRDIMKATIGQQVGLIKSIPAQYHTNIESMVMRSVQTGRDLGTLTKDLQEQYGVTRRRAALIARDQNNKATASMTRARQDELGIVEAIWQHSGGGKHPRPEHVAANGKKYDIKKGMLIEGEWVLPGEKIGCRCVSRPLIKGFS